MASKALVVGSGAIGLRTALELLRRNVSVTLRSARPPWHESTCSQGAGGLWMPFHCDDHRTDRWALETFDFLMNKTETKEAETEVVPTVIFKRHHQGPTVEHFVSNSSPLPEWSKDERLQFQHLTVEMLWWQNRIHKLRLPSLQQLLEAGYLHAWLFHPPIVDPPRMLKNMLQELQSHSSCVDANVDTGHEYTCVQEMVEDAVRLGCNVVVNCTGLGAASVCNDTKLVGARGILVHYNRKQCYAKQEDDDLKDAAILVDEPPWGSETEPCYLIPRGDIVVVGGSCLENDFKKSLSAEETRRLVGNAHLLGVDTDAYKHVAEWTGFRPYRPTVRCEVDHHFGKQENIKVVHNYGHGGSGWTVFVGAAIETANLVVQ